MTEGQARNAREVRAFLDNLGKSDWLDSSKRWWPKFVYHFTDIRNAVSILEQDTLFSRNAASHLGIMVTDNASPQVIAQTREQLKDYVRLYFRPQTPTQFHNEGFRPSAHYGLEAHCPMPVYFLFDSQEILARPDSRFSNGSLASPGSRVFSTIEELNQMPFSDIYHDGQILDDEDRRRQIVSRRQAEVVVPNRLDLAALRFIVCRSEAERETLSHLLTLESHNRWQSKINVENSKSNLFLKRWLYVESAELSDSSITLHFNLNATTEHNGPFNAVASITDTRSGKRFAWRSEQFTSKSKLTLDGFPPLNDYSVEFTLDDQVAYAGSYQNDWQDLPW